MMIRTLKFASAIIIPLCVLVFVISMRAGIWDRWFGIDKVLLVAENFEKSYTPDACFPVRPGDLAWKPLLKLIGKFSIANLPKDREPKVFARSAAILSQKIDIGPGVIAEWTAPSTPIVLIYRNWPGQTVPPQDYRIVGTISDLRTWINRSKDDFRFFMQDIFLGVLSVILVTIVWATEKQTGKKRQGDVAKLNNIKK